MFCSGFLSWRSSNRNLSSSEARVKRPKQSIDAKPVASEDICPHVNGNGRAHSALSEREMEILGCLAGGNSNKVIARTCQIAESTVKIHLKSILRKIHVQNRTQAAIWAIQNNLFRVRSSPPIMPGELSQELPEPLALQGFPKADYD